MRLPNITATLVAAICLAPHAASAGQRPPASRWVEFNLGELVKTRDGHALAHDVTSTASNDTFWTLVEVSTPEGARQCEFLKKFPQKASFRVECALPAAAPGQSYAARLTMYFDDRLERRELRFEPVFAITADAIAAADKAGVPSIDPARIVADGVDEGASLPAPATFEPTRACAGVEPTDSL